jgi:WD40 repeat protein
MRPRLSRLLYTFCALAIPAGAFSLPAAGPMQPRLDAYGDPLPPGATARFGSLRWRMPGDINEVAVSPDGKRVACVNSHGRVAIWDMATGRQLHALAGSETGEGCLAFSPDGRYLATGGRQDPEKRRGDYRVRVWEVKTGMERACLPRQEGPILKVAFAPDGKTLISGGSRQPVVVWAFPGGQKLREFLVRGDNSLPFALSPNGRWLAIPDAPALTLYPFERGARHITLQTEGFFDAFRFSADSRWLLTEGPDKLRFWEIATGKERQQIGLAQNSSRRAYPSPDGRKVALIGVDSSIHWLDLSTGKPTGSWSGPLDRVTALAFTPSGRAVVSGEWGAIRVWDAATGKMVQAPSGPSLGCYALAFSPDGRTLVVGGTDLHFLDGGTLRERKRVHVEEMDWPHGLMWRQSVDVSPDGMLAATVGAEGSILLVSTQSGEVVRTLRRRGLLAHSVAFDPGGKKLYAVGQKDEVLLVWDVGTGKEGPALCTNLVWTSNLAVAPEGGTLAVATGGPKPRCRLWDLRMGKELPGLEDAPDYLLLSRDGRFLAGYHHNSHIAVWDVAKRDKVRRFDFGVKAVTAWAFSADGRLLVLGHSDGSFVTLRLADGKKLAEVRAHTGGVVALACSPDGEALISACSACTVLRWEAAAWKGK